MSIKEAIKRGFVFYIINSLIIACQFAGYLIKSPQMEYMDTIGYLFFACAAISHAALFGLLPYSLSVLTLLISRSSKAAGMIHVFFAALLNVLFYINGHIFSLYRLHLNGMMLSLFFGEGSSEIFQFDASIYAKSAFAIIMIIIINISIRIATDFFFSRKQKCHFVTVLIIFMATLIFSNVTHAYAAVAQKQSVVQSASHLPYYFPLTATRFMIKMGVVEQTDLLKADFGKQKGVEYPKKPITTTDTTGYNIILIAIDSWNYRSLTPDVMPNITNFAADNELYTNHLSSSNGTRGGVFGMFYGTSSYYWTDFDINGITPVIINTMQDKGYQIKAFSSATLNNPNFNKLLFRKVPDIQTVTKGERVYDRDCQITTDFVNFIDTADTAKPFFSFIFYDLAHSFQFPNELEKRFVPSWDFADYMKLSNNTDPTPFWNLYLNCTNLVDSLVGIVLSKIEEHDLLSNTYIIITGDHGQEFNENHKNYWGHGSNYTMPQIHIPFIMHRPCNNPCTFSHRTTHYDITATLMRDALGAENNVTDYSMGRPLNDTTPRNWHIVGDNLNYAFIVDSNIIVEKKPSGWLNITDSTLTPIRYKPSAQALNNAINKLNMFYEQQH
mgnify:CR=1 FL=1